MNDPTDDIKETLKERLKLCAAFSLASDESTDISDTAQLVIFIRAATVEFDVVEEFFDMASLSSTTTGQDICEDVISVDKKFGLNPAKLCGLTTDGAPSIIGMTNGINKFMDAIGAQDVVVLLCSCIYYSQRELVYLAFAEVLKNVDHCVNYIRA